ncbi:hypothetical protein GTZ99_12375 [Novosphingobium sp. FSY-8]|uniref:Uncharacterized protein n=1 Tax=Novosphingobium ovatum TaxID=1908523 RepID=A0ABW9XFR1_9SPHN|nr:hypothetical protein [Novosphingobium ovatum]NBC37346.1 hypothetical protein [Novosphingobium ovatum]
MSGFIALHREAFSHPVLKDADRFRAWFWLVAHAAWKPTRHDARGRTITVERGQICAGREHLAKEWKWSPSAVERFLTRLETEQMIERETGQGKTIITICNYDKYQDFGAETEQLSGQQTGQKSDRNRTTKEQGKQGNNNPSDTSYPQDLERAPLPDAHSDEIPAKPKRKPPIKRTAGVDHPLPADWQPILTLDAQTTVDGWPPGMFDKQLAAFRDHAADKGRMSKDWQAAFRTWIRNAKIWTPANDQRPQAHRGIPARPQRVDGAIAALDRELHRTGAIPDEWR